MGERKVVNRYFPPDFDPAKIPRMNRNKRAQKRIIRMMLPWTIRCNACGTYMHVGKKFNMKKEAVGGFHQETSETYMGIQIWRFYMTCVFCKNEITFKTDPKNADYICERGATNNSNPWKKKDVTLTNMLEAPDANAAQDRADERQATKDTMQQLEERTLASRREMDVLDELDEIKAHNRDRRRVTIDDALAAVRAPHRGGRGGAARRGHRRRGPARGVRRGRAAQRARRGGRGRALRGRERLRRQAGQEARRGRGRGRGRGGRQQQ